MRRDLGMHMPGPSNKRIMQPGYLLKPFRSIPSEAVDRALLWCGAFSDLITVAGSGLRIVLPWNYGAGRFWKQYGPQHRTSRLSFVLAVGEVLW
jgi:hypothetical protein